MDAISLIKQDHKTIESLFRRFERAGEDAHREKRALVDQITRELSAHAAVEEQLLYPLARKRLKDHEDDVLESLEEHHIVKWTLHELENLKPTAERFDAKVAVLIESVRHHVEEEESELLPALEAALPLAERRSLGERMAQTKKVAPLRPHPRSPDSPPANLVAGPVAGAMDRGKIAAKSLAARTARAPKSAASKSRRKRPAKR